MAFQRSSSADAALLTFKGFDVFGAGAAMESHKSSSSSCLVTFAAFFGRKLVAGGRGMRKIPLKDLLNARPNTKSNGANSVNESAFVSFTIHAQVMRRIFKYTIDTR